MRDWFARQANIYFCALRFTEDRKLRIVADPARQCELDLAVLETSI